MHCVRGLHEIILRSYAYIMCFDGKARSFSNKWFDCAKSNWITRKWKFFEREKKNQHKQRERNSNSLPNIDSFKTIEIHLQCNNSNKTKACIYAFCLTVGVTQINAKWFYSSTAMRVNSFIGGFSVESIILKCITGGDLPQMAAWPPGTRCTKLEKE